MKKILVVAAHPDDEILGCGATMARLSEEGHEVYTLILGEGVTSRDKARDTQLREKEINFLREEILNANKCLGVKKVFIKSFSDNRFDSHDLLDVVKAIEEVKLEIEPDIVFTHSCDDLNIDHQITAKAVLVAMRPLADETINEIYSFEILSSSEWNFPKSFAPDVFFEVNNFISKKKKALEYYKSEMRNAPHPRSIEIVENLAKLRGSTVGIDYAEAFKLIRMIK